MLKVMIKNPIINYFRRFILKITKKIKIFLKCSLEHSQFTNRCSSVSHKNPSNWKKLIIDGTCRVRKSFKQEDIDVVLSADETFLRFHEYTKIFWLQQEENGLELHFPSIKRMADLL